MPHSPTAAAITDAIEELEAYDDAEHRAVLELVRELLDLNQINEDDAASGARASLY